MAWRRGYCGRIGWRNRVRHRPPYRRRRDRARAKARARASRTIGTSASRSACRPASRPAVVGRAAGRRPAAPQRAPAPRAAAPARPPPRPSSAPAPRPRPSRRGRGRSARPRGSAAAPPRPSASSALAVPGDATSDSVPRTRLTQRGQAGAAERAEDAAGEQAAAERQAAAQHVGLEADQRAADRAAPDRRLPLVEAQAQLVAAGEPRRRIVALGAAVEAVQADQRRVFARTSASSSRGERLLRLRGRRAGSALPMPIAGAGAGAAARAGRRRSGSGSVGERDARQAVGDRLHRGLEGREAARAPGAAQARHRAAAARRRAALPRRRASSVELLHPAARERVERQHRAHVRGYDARCARQRATLGRLDAPARGAPSWLSSTITGLPIQAEQLHLGRDVAGRLGRLGGVDEVEHHVGLVAHVAHRLLAGPERPVAPAVPDLAQEPADRLLDLAQALHQAHAVAEAGRVPEQQPLAFGRLEQRRARRRTR